MEAIDWSAEKRAASLRLLEWKDTAVIEDAAALLVLEKSSEAMSLLCEALAIQEEVADFEGQETILWALSPAWKSGEVDVPSLLRAVRDADDDRAAAGATIAMKWLELSANCRSGTSAFRFGARVTYRQCGRGQWKRRRCSSSAPVGGRPVAAVGRFAATASSTTCLAQSASLSSPTVISSQSEPLRRTELVHQRSTRHASTE